MAKLFKDGGFYRGEQQKLTKADGEEHADPRTKPNYMDK